MTKQICTVSDVVRAVEAIAPPQLAEDWDLVGLQVGHPSAKVKRIMTCLELTPFTFEEAVNLSIDVIVAHHPLIFKPLTSLNLAQPVGGLIARLMKSEISFIAAHTNFDSAKNGVSQILAEACGLTIDSPMLPKAEDASCGLGCIATLPTAETAKSLAELIGKRLKSQYIRLSGKPEKRVKRVAVSPGSGGSFIGKVASLRADALITGEINYHQAIEAYERGIAVIELGHFESEVLAIQPLANMLSQSEKLAAAEVEVLSALKDFQPFRFMEF